MLLGAGLLWLVPLSWIDNGASVCLIKNITGHECWGCGMTRAFFHLIHGEFTVAYAYNWRIVIVFPLFAWIVARAFVRQMRSHRSQRCQRGHR